MDKKRICDFEEFNIIEGLIKSYDIEKVISYFEKLIKGTFEINRKNKFSFDIILHNDVDESDIYQLINSLTIYGYYISYYFILLDNNRFFKAKYNKERFVDIYNKNKNINTIKFIIESKYDDYYHKNTKMINYPDKLYHLAPSRYIKTIKENGLIPSSNSRTSLHPDRIYLFSDINSTQKLINQFQTGDYDKFIRLYKDNTILIKKYDIYNRDSNFYDYFLIEIDMTKNDFKKTVILNTDPNFLNGYFTTDNIYPDNLIFLS